MKKTNWKIRIKNPVFIFQVLGAIVLSTLAANNVQISDLTSWSAFFNLIVSTVSNPYILMTVLWTGYCSITDPGANEATKINKMLKSKQRKGDK